MCDLLGTLVCFLVCVDVFIIWDIAYMRYLRFCRFETYYRLLYRFYLVVQLGGKSERVHKERERGPWMEEGVGVGGCLLYQH